MTGHCIVFDADGVLVDMDQAHFDALNEALGELGNEAVITEEEHRSTFKGLPTRVKLRMLVDQGRIYAGEISRVASLKQVYTVKAIKNLRPDPEKLDLLARLRAWGWRIAVCSNAVRESVREMLEYTGLRDLVEFYLSNEDAPPKPDPGMYLKAAEIFGVSPCDLVVVEDSEPGKASARAAGCQLVPVSGPQDVTLKLIPTIQRAVGEHIHLPV